MSKRKQLNAALARIAEQQQEIERLRAIVAKVADAYREIDHATGAVQIDGATDRMARLLAAAREAAEATKTHD